MYSGSLESWPGLLTGARVLGPDRIRQCAPARQRSWTTRAPTSSVEAAPSRVANENADAVCQAAHQAHETIGVTGEYRLLRYTRRLNSWRGDFGTEPKLARRVGCTVFTDGSCVGTALRSGRGTKVPG